MPVSGRTRAGGLHEKRDRLHARAVTADSLDDYMQKLVGRLELLTEADVVSLSTAIESGRIAADRLESGEAPPGASREELERIVGSAKHLSRGSSSATCG